MRKLVTISAFCLTLSLSCSVFATSPVQSAADNNAKLHVVQSKETLSGIATTYGISLEQIVKFNSITNPNQILIGQTLFIPENNAAKTTANQTTTAVAPQSATPPTSAPKVNYIVKPRDTLHSIAVAHGLTVDQVAATNNIENPNVLKIGQVLTLPGVTQLQTVASRSDHRESRRESREDKDQAAEIVDYAKKFLGCSYSYGASGPRSFDCSGLTMHVYKHFGISLPHSSASQAKEGEYVKKSDLQEGDLVFFNTSSKGISHVGIYIGGGEFIHASTSKRNVEISSLSESYYDKRYVTARRVI